MNWNSVLLIYLAVMGFIGVTFFILFFLDIVSGRYKVYRSRLDDYERFADRLRSKRFAILYKSLKESEHDYASEVDYIALLKDSQLELLKSLNLGEISYASYKAMTEEARSRTRDLLQTLDENIDEVDNREVMR